MHVGTSWGYNYNMRSNYTPMYILILIPIILYPIMIHDAWIVLGQYMGL
jgi:hypothetical protein